MATGLDLTIVVGYDKHSWTAGWKHFMDGMTVFYSEWGDDQLDKSASFQATPQNIPMVRLQLNNLTHLAAPYSECSPGNFTRQNCLLKCQAKFVLDRCGCLPPQMCSKSMHEVVKACSLYQHITCLKGTYLVFVVFKKFMFLYFENNNFKIHISSRL